MAFVPLRITTPKNNMPVEGLAETLFRGEVVEDLNEIKNVPLYFRWYSSLYEPEMTDDEPPKPDHFAINNNLQTRANKPFSWQPGIGSHAITLAVSDQQGEEQADLLQIKHAGVTGGAPIEEQCLIHVFHAVLLPPKDGFNPVSRDSLLLIAQAPSSWMQPDSESVVNDFKINQDYHEINRLQYRWEFIPVGAINGRPTIDFIPTLEQLEFGRYSSVNDEIPETIDPDDIPNPADVFVVHIKPNDHQTDQQLADWQNVTGTYNLILHVEDSTDENIGHDSSSIEINFAP